MAPFSHGISPYAYAYNDPINNIDFFGLGPFDWLWKFIIRIINNKFRATYSDIHHKIICHQHSKVKTPPPHELSNTNIPYIPESIPVQSFPSPSLTITPPQVEINPKIPSTVSPDFFFAGDEVSGHITFKIQSVDIDFENTANVDFLNKLVNTLIEYPQIVIEIKANLADMHPEKTVSEQGIYNMSMSRARAIIKYLRSRGVINKLIALPGER